jgi:hypothetical protein
MKEVLIYATYPVFWKREWMCIIGFMRDFSLPILVFLYVTQWTSVCVALNLAASWRISRMNVCINRLQNVRRSEEKLFIIINPTFPRNKITSIPVKFGAEILKNVYLILTLLYILASGWLSRYNDSLWAGRSGDRIPVETRFSASVHTGCGGPTSLLYSGSRFSVAGAKRPGRGVSHPPPFSAENKGSLELYLSLSAFMASSRV